MITHLGGDVVDGDAMRDSISRPRVPRFSRVLAAAWRATLVAVAEGSDPQQARAALLALEFDSRRDR